MKFRNIIAFMAIFSILPISSAHAYLDPGTGSAIVSAILGFFAAVGFTIRKYYYRIKAFFRGGASADEINAGASEDKPTPPPNS